MRDVLPIVILSAFLVQPVSAQGVKDPPNYTVPNSQNTLKMQQAQAPSSRPTAIRNIPTGSLPAGVAVQGVYRDGKLTAVPR